jgi:hypothetical protein
MAVSNCRHRRETSVVDESQTPGLLKVSGAFTQWTADGRSCVIDFRVSNDGGSDLMINAVEFQELESVHQMPMGQAKYSALYDLDISGLDGYLTQAECEVAQILKPGEADRFAIVVSAPKSGLPGGWRLATTFKTNVGSVSGPEIDVWVPRVGIKVPSIGSLKEHYASNLTKQAAHFPGVQPWQLIKTEPAGKGGFRSVFSGSTHIIWYCGPRPLIEDPSQPIPDTYDI